MYHPSIRTSSSIYIINCITVIIIKHNLVNDNDDIRYEWSLYMKDFVHTVILSVMVVLQSGHLLTAVTLEAQFPHKQRWLQGRSKIVFWASWQITQRFLSLTKKLYKKHIYIYTYKYTYDDCAIWSRWSAVV
jgi:hypothetical protein